MRNFLAISCLTALLVSCADTGETPVSDGGASTGNPPQISYDAGSLPGYVPPGSSSTPTPTPTPVSPAPARDGGPDRVIAGDSGVQPGSIDFESLLGSKDGGATTPPVSSGDAGTGNAGKGELDPNGAVNPNLPPKPGNPAECPSLAPPNPVGLCLGLPIYVVCGYGKDGGQQYTCTCDWYHWLCA